MKTLIRLELKKNKLNTYIIAGTIITIIMLGFLFLFAYAPLIEPNDKELSLRNIQGSALFYFFHTR